MRKPLAALACLVFAQAAVADGTLPKSEDGRPLNLDFETGDLRDWKTEGEAFNGQPIKGDTVAPRRGDMKSQHQGDFWIGGFEKFGDKPVGTLTSVPFKVTHPWATFLTNGGPHHETRVELVSHDTGKVFYAAIGTESENMRRIVVDLTPQMGQEIFVRVVDEHPAHWGHINFDDFRFHAEKPGEPTPPGTALRPDEYPHSGLSAEEAAKAMTLPDGFKVTVCAAEPDVKQPIAMCLDHRGRVWIAEAYEYPQRAEGDKGRDRILIFEDTNGDDKFDSRKVFAEGLNLVSGLEVGFGGVWVGAAPYLLFIPDKDGDDKPDGEPEILLDGWGYQDTHETLNAFIWGPDGWLYGCHGVFTHSRVGKPGTPDAERVPINAGIWRYHPTRHEFEVFAHGTSNPWGVDFDDHGQAFCTACVIPHLFHIIQGGRYHRQAGQHFNPYTYDDIKTVADHVHWLGDRPHGGNDKSDAAGGGHAHAGAMIYLGGAWPEEYRGQIFMNNIHGQRLNVDILKPNGSGYVGSHGPDFLLTGDRASQILNMRYGPDGHVYIIDWYDMQACHLREVEKHDRSNGRIYKITYGDAKPVSADVAKATDKELVEWVFSQNEWFSRHARRVLQERAANGKLNRETVTMIRAMTERSVALGYETLVLRGYWALHVCGELDRASIGAMLDDPSPYVRGWGVQLALDRPNVDPTLSAKLTEMSRGEASPVVRLYLASALQKLPPAERWEILANLTAHPEDAADHNLPLMYWYAAEPLAEVDPERALAFAMSAGENVPILRDFMLRRIGSGDAASSLPILVRGLGKAEDAKMRLVFLNGIRAALKGQRQVKPPKEWAGVSAELVKSDNADVRRQATALAVTFGDRSAIESFRKLAVSADADVAARRQALESLLAANDPELPGVLIGLLGNQQLREVAIRGLAQYSEAKAAPALIGLYPKLTPEEKRAVLGTLCARPEYGMALLSAVEQKQIPGTDLTADLVRQLRFLRNEKIDSTLNDVWGTARDTPADRKQQIDQLKALMAKSPAVERDLSHGRAIFAKTCQKCHALYGTGGDIGPDLTGSNRSDLDYLLTNIVDPGAVMAKEYQPTTFYTVTGRVVSGIVKEETAKAVTVQTADEVVVLPTDEIDERLLSENSMMPNDQLRQFSDHEVGSLLAYLSARGQVPMAATEDNVASFFNGKDLTGWEGDEKLWSVENGEIVGKTATGIKKNSFLISDLSASDFELTLEVKLIPNEANSGIQFRSQEIGEHEVKGYQADAGAGWWGKLYEEHGRALLWDKSGEEHVKQGEWNTYRIRAEGDHIQTWINGQPCVDLKDPEGAKKGVFALQLHSGGPTEVRFRNLKLELIGEKKSE